MKTFFPASKPARSTKLALAIALCALAAPAAHSQEFPSRTIRVIVGFGPGGVADIAARVVSQGLAKKLGKAVVVENMPGAGGVTAATTAARAQPDGHTLFLMSNLNAVSPSLFKTLSYDPVKQFQPISMIGSFDLVVVVDKASPLKTVKDIASQAAKAPDQFNIGTIGIGSTQYLSARMFTTEAKLNVPTVPFKTSGDVITALKGGTVQVGFETLPAVASQIKAGSLHPVAVTSLKRNPVLPDVPTVAESGVPNFEAASWNGLAAPAGTPKDVVAKLQGAVAEVVKDSETTQKLKEVGLEPRTSTPEEFQRFLVSEIQKWRSVIERAQIEKQ